MSKPLVTFPDPETVLIDFLKAEFLPRVEAYKPTSISPNFPTAALAGSATHLQVELESSNTDDYPVTERSQVRISGYANGDKRSNVKALASLSMGLLGAAEGVPAIAGIEILGGRSDVTTDPTTKNLICWFLVRVNLKATLLAS